MSQAGLSNNSPAAQGTSGFFTLSGAATTVVDNSNVQSGSVILYSLKTLGTVSAMSTLTYTIIAGTSFTVTPSNSADTSTYGYVIFN